ncbi:hypothetical protein [Kitasatospora sp. NPDC004272]
MPDSIRPADRQHPERLAVVATISLDVELLLLPPNPVHPRIDTVVRYGDQLAVINGTPAATPLPAPLGPEMTPIGQVYIRPWGFGFGPDQITNLQTEQRCCECGTTEHSGRAFYENYQGKLFCWPCAGGDRPCGCHQPPVRQSQHVAPVPAPSAKDDGSTWRHLSKYLPRNRG